MLISGRCLCFYVQVYDSSGNAVGSETNLSNGSLIQWYISRPVTSGQTYYIRVRPYDNNSGTYQIGFNAWLIPPGLTPIQLTLNTWADGNIPTSGDVQWSSFTATASTQYIHFNFGTLGGFYVQVYDSSGNVVGTETNITTTKYISPPVTSGQTYYIRVRPSSINSGGTYRIGFTAGLIPPNPIPLLNLDTWADCTIDVNGEQWFSFTATDATQFIHFNFGTLEGLYVQVYNSSGLGMSGETGVYSNTAKYIQRQFLTPGQTYYIKIRVYYNDSRGYGTYQIGFNEWLIPPSVVTFSPNTWVEGRCPTISDVRWLSFTATASTQFFHVYFFDTGTKWYLQIYDSNGNEVGGEEWLSGSSTTTAYIQRSLTSGQTYYIRLRSSDDSRSFRIVFTSSSTPPASW
ncbi:hypothetical protein [Treponema sp. R6D11]